MHAASDFRTIRSGSEGTVEEELVKLAKHIDCGCFKVVSVSSSKHSCVVICSTELGRAELSENGLY